MGVDVLSTARILFIDQLLRNKRLPLVAIEAEPAFAGHRRRDGCNVSLPPSWQVRAAMGCARLDTDRCPRRLARVRMPPMALASGTRLGPYEVLAPLGAGGPASARRVKCAGELRRGRAVANWSAR